MKIPAPIMESLPVSNGEGSPSIKEKCLVEGCITTIGRFRAGFCGAHYQKIRKYGKNVCLRARKGEGSLSHGYKVFRKEGCRIREHVFIAEKAIGRKLTSNEVVHHIDGNRSNNSPSNLLICTKEYHNLLHKRMRALSEGGDPDFLKCKYCKEWDSPNKLYVYSSGNYHIDCMNSYRRNRRATRVKSENS